MTSKIKIKNEMLTVHEIGRGTHIIPLDAIEAYQIKRSTYDLPLVQETVVLTLTSGRVIKIKRLPKHRAHKLISAINERIKRR